MKNQTALPSLTVNPSNVLPSLPPFLRPPSSPPPLFSLLSLHLSPSGGRTLGVPKQAVEHQHHLAVRPIHRRTDITRGQRETRRDGRGDDSTEAPAADGRNRASASRPTSLGAEASDRGRPWEQHLLRGSARSHRRPPARSPSSSSAPLVFGPGGSLGSPVPRGERTLEGSLVDVERNGLQNTQAQYRTSLKPCGGSFGHAAYLNRYRRGSEVLWTRRRPPSLPSR